MRPAAEGRLRIRNDVFMAALAALALCSLASVSLADGPADETAKPAGATGSVASANPAAAPTELDAQKAIAPGADSKSPGPGLYTLPFKLGMDYYNGFSSVPGHSRFSDGLWAGSNLAAPSVGYARFDDGRGNAMRVSVGIGGMYTGGGTTLNQPVEAYWQRTIGATSVTIGKYWLPFGSQEWEYETKPGVMLQWSAGPHSLALSTNYNTTTHRINTYAHASRAFGRDASLGLSFGGGKGLTYDSLHDVMWGVDAMYGFHGFRFTGEYVAALRGSQGFGFTTGKVAYERLGAWRPYVGVYSWNDQTGAFGRFRSQVYGMQYQITPSTAIDTAIAPTSSRRTYWLQVHTSWER